jgi:SAM-dependent methyltransferase
MSNLYQDLSTVYEAMYQSFIDYNDEAAFYGEILLRYQCAQVLEIGCGTGNLADLFTRQGIAYQGLDQSEDMLQIARSKAPNSNFFQGDMRDFQLPKPIASAIITGRTISYLITNQDLMDAFGAIHQQLLPSGVLAFDFIDANSFIPQIKPGERVVHSAEFDGKRYHRESFWSVNLAQSWTFDWLSRYFQADTQELWQPIGEDQSTIRAFCQDDIALFLKLSGFAVNEFIARPSYAFDTFVVVAQKL